MGGWGGNVLQKILSPNRALKILLCTDMLVYIIVSCLRQRVDGDNDGNSDDG